jgi:hypothetical protein
MEGYDPVVMQAIKNAIEKHPIDDWWACSPRRRVRAIYDEIRRLDTNRMKADVRTQVAAGLVVV